MDSKELYKELVSNDLVKKNFFILSTSIDLFAEAIKCYNSTTYLACCICVRSSIEALFHIAKTRTLTSLGAAAVDFDNSSYNDLKKWVIQNNLIDSDLEKKTNQVRHLGNFGAHLAQKIDKAYKKMPEEKPIDIWVTKDQAWNSLMNCKDLILHIAKKKWK
ncbi:DUF4145 domain-containing protein [Thermoproteota archaeon]